MCHHFDNKIEDKGPQEREVTDALITSELRKRPQTHACTDQDGEIVPQLVVKLAGKRAGKRLCITFNTWKSVVISKKV